MSLRSAEIDDEWTAPTALPLVTQPGLLRRAKVWALKPASWSPEKVRQNYVDSGLTPTELPDWAHDRRATRPDSR